MPGVLFFRGERQDICSYQREDDHLSSNSSTPPNHPSFPLPTHRFTSIHGQDQSKPLPYSPTSPLPTQILSSLSQSLSNLSTTYLDSLLLHSPFPTRSDTLTAYRTLLDAQQEGKVRMLGISNCYDVQELSWLWKETGGKVDVVQNRWYQGNGWDKEVYEFCKETGIRYQ